MKFDTRSMVLWLLTSLGTLGALGALGAPAWAQATTLGGDLGDWLDDHAVPELTSLLSEHPRFKGQVIDIVAIDKGQPAAIADELAERIRDQLTLALVRETGVRIPFDTRCEPVHTVLGIEIDRASTAHFNVTLAMLDLDESIWINGTAQRWSGRLNSGQRRMLATRIADTRCDNAMSVAMSGNGDPVLISDIVISDAANQCRDAHCVDVSVELFDAAYVLPFYTRNGSLTPRYCRLPARDRSGGLNYGINVPAGDNPSGPSLGFYLLAVEDREVAREMIDTLAMASSACGNAATAPVAWMGRLESLLANAGGAVTWRALHLIVDSRGIRRFE